jgi:hypothetical protein
VTPLAARLEGRGFGWAVALICLFSSLILLATTVSRIPGLEFADADDALRYVQVHDFIAGQSWFDVSQHRINPPVGGPMHWSRIVDLPIAGAMLLFRPFVGAALADRLAVSIVPLLLLCALIWVTALAGRRIAGRVEGFWVALLLATMMTILFQFQPLRIDHHGWQILMAAVAFWAMFDDRPARGGLVAGGTLAVWLCISSEALPYDVLFGGIFALQWWFGRRAGDALFSYLPALVGGSAVLLLATRGPYEAVAFYCDALSPVYLLPMAAAAAVLLAGRKFVTGPVRRIILTAIAGAAAGVIYLAFAGKCLAGPFETLDPLVYRYWYLQVLEGRPVWEQAGLVAGLILLVPLPGLIGSIMAALNAKTPEESWLWTIVTLLALGAFVLSLLVMRTMSVAHLFALPGAVWLGQRLFVKARDIDSTVPRVLATVGLFFLMPPGVAATVGMTFPGIEGNAIVNGQKVDMEQAKSCRSAAGLVGLARMPQGVVFAQLDVGPFILAFTPHAVVGTGHHRNIAGMRDVVTAFTQPQVKARAIIARHHGAYVAFCPALGEMQRYGVKFPRGLAADLLASRPPSWLQPVATGVDQPLWIYRVNR